MNSNEINSEDEDIFGAGDATRITEKTLFMVSNRLAKYGTTEGVKGYMGITFFMMYFFTGFFYFLLLKDSTDIEDLYFALLTLLGILGVCMVVFIIPNVFLWRFECPICFNKERQKIFFWEENELLQQEWKDVEFYVSRLPGFSTSGSTYSTAFDMYGSKTGKKYTTFIEYTHTSKSIANFMAGEPNQVSLREQEEIRRANLEFDFKDIFVFNYHLIPKGGWLFFIPLFTVVFFIIPINVIVYGLNKYLPRKNPPAELLEACGYDKDYKVYG